ncbi:MAG: hypothetical protein JWM39_708 [Parcubacteria group bacterium]|nr:hypothetical protein [Parcubacteria group bacterium]
MFEPVIYSLRDTDATAHMLFGRLGATLEAQFKDLGMRDCAGDHAGLEIIRGREPPCAPSKTVSIFTTKQITYPSRYFRYIATPECRTKLGECLPIWARSSRLQIAFNPDADITRMDPETGKYCIELALLDLQRKCGGWHPPPKQRPKRKYGRAARREREQFVG